MPIVQQPTQQQPSSGNTQGIPGQQQANQIPPANSATSKMLPATGLQQQVNTLQASNQGLQAVGGYQPPNQQSALQRPGQTNLNDMAENLAKNYGVALGSTPLVDEQGNFNRLPTSGSEAVGFQFISQAISNEQNQRQQAKATAAMQTGIGQVQNRARGSLATMQSGQFEHLASMYEQQQYHAADFSYFVQKEQMDRAEQLIRRQEKISKKKGTYGMIGGIMGGVVGAWFGGPAGAAVGMSAGSAIGSGMA